MNKTIFSQIDFTNIKGVIIDIDNTLYPYEPTHQHAIKVCYNTFMRTFERQETFDEFYQKYREKRTEVTQRLSPQGACRSRLFAFLALFEELAFPQPFNHALTFETLYWNSFIDNIECWEEAHQFLVRCKDCNLPVCALSDMQAHFQIQKLQALQVDYLIDALVTSEEVGAEKPHAIIFEAALKKLKLSANEVIMVGDHKEKDIMGAQNLGIQSYWVEAL